jgi:hypothetical protein
MRAKASWVLLLAVVGARAYAADRAVPASAEQPVEQPFLYLTDPHGPAAHQVLAGYGLAFSSSPGAIRPIPGRFDQEAVVHALSIDAGLTSRLSVFGDAMIAQAIGRTSVGAFAVEAGGRVRLTRPSDRRWSVTFKGAALLEFGHDLGIVGELTGSYDLGRVRLAAALHAEHIFASGRDPIDLYAVAGASVRVVPILRLGLEYVVQDLEAAFENDEAEKGARHYLGPDVALSLWRSRVLVTVGVAAQAARQPGVLGRAALTYVY